MDFRKYTFTHGSVTVVIEDIDTIEAIARLQVTVQDPDAFMIQGMDMTVGTFLEQARLMFGVEA